MITYIQTRTPNPNISCAPGWCLVYVQSAYGIGAKSPTAIAAWESSTHKHEDTDFPTTAAVPIWFSVPYNAAGHVAIHEPDGSIYSSSSPTSNTPVHHPSLEAMQEYFGHKLTVLGWTEDVEGTLVVEAREIEAEAVAASITTGSSTALNYVLAVDVPGFGTSSNAAGHANQVDTVKAGSYAIYNQAHGVINITKVPGKPGSWINPADNVVAAPVVHADAPDTHAVTETITITDTLSVRSGPGTTYAAKQANTPDGSLHKGDVVQIIGWGHGENVAGNSVWLRSVRGNWFWSGATSFDMNQTITAQVADTPPAKPPVVAPPVAPVVESPAPSVAATDAGTKVDVKLVTAQVPATAPNYDFKQSWRPGQGTFQLKQNITVKDYSGSFPDVDFKKGDVLLRAGTFTVKNLDGSETLMARTAQSVKKAAWYGFPQKLLNPVPTTMLSPEDLISIGQQVGKDIEDEYDNLFNDPMFQSTISKLDEDFSAGLKDIQKAVNDKTTRAKIIDGIIKAENIFKRKK